MVLLYGTKAGTQYMYKPTINRVECGNQQEITKFDPIERSNYSTNDLAFLPHWQSTPWVLILKYCSF